MVEVLDGPNGDDYSLRPNQIFAVSLHASPLDDKTQREVVTVREDYSAEGNAWEYFDHDQARSRAYRWNEDGLGGICDEAQHLCF